MKMRCMTAGILLWTSLIFFFAPAALAQAPAWLPGAEQWQPYLEQSPADWSQLAQDPWGVLKKLVLSDFPETFRQTIRDYAEVLLFLALEAILGVLLEESEERPLLDLICACGCGILLWKKLVLVSQQLGSQLEQWRQFLLNFLPVYAGVLALGGEPAAGAAANGFLLTALCGLAQLLAFLVPPLLQCYLALSIACCISTEHQLGAFCKGAGALLQAALRWAGKLLAALFGIQRAATLQLDRTALKAGQLLTGTVPIIGQSLSDASEAVLAGVQVLKSGLGFAAATTLASEFLPIYLEMLLQLGLLAGCRLLCSLTGADHCETLLGCFVQAVRCMMACVALFFGLAVLGTALLFLVGGGG